ncbi:hypothetical protein [Ktedonobacter sp. SOSP1-52]|uniref:hypothetical protein n=1 Tax=Ktedonobacter sp. SOSP1-52 TaxID=2778366 RepID=UPI0019161354|nr:hypothetical protein [Ktedonobacter sp. SOSP1-52]
MRDYNLESDTIDVGLFFLRYLRWARARPLSLRSAAPSPSATLSASPPSLTRPRVVLQEIEGRQNK